MVMGHAGGKRKRWCPPEEEKRKKETKNKQKIPQKEPEKKRLSSIEKIIQIIDLSVASYYDEKGSTVLTFKTIGQVM
jgi:hypothetical protein